MQVTGGSEIAGREAIASQAHESLATSSGVLLVGPAGIGKSALIEHLGNTLTAGGAYVEPVLCSEMTIGVPFAPLMHLLPQATGLDASLMGRSLIDRLKKRAKDRQLVVLVDDLQHSDPGTASVVFSLITQGEAKVVAATRPADTTAAAVRTLWKDGLLNRIDLPRLADSALMHMAEQLTGAPLTARLRTELTKRADGNPFFLSALTRVGLGSGAIQENGAGSCDLARALPVSSEVSDLLHSQLSKVSAEARQIVDMIAIGENMPVELFGDTKERQIIEDLAATGLVAVDYATPNHATRCAHPLIGEYLRSRLSASRRKEIHRSLVERVSEQSEPAPLDLMRAASMAIADDIDVDATMLLDAATAAFNVIDLDLALAAASRAKPNDPTGRSDLLIGTTQALVGEIDEANHHFDLAEAFDLSEEQQAKLAIARSRMAVFFEEDPDKGERLLNDAYRVVSSQDLRLELGATMIFPLAMNGRNAEAIALGAELTKLNTAKPELEVNVLAMLSMVKYMVADFDGLAEIVAQARESGRADAVHLSIFGPFINMAEVACLQANAQLVEGHDLVKSLYDMYLLDDRAIGESAGWSAALTRIQSMTGALADALQHTAIALAEADRSDDPIGLAPMAIASRCVALSLAGQLSEAAEIFTLLSPDYARRHRRAAHWRAWAEAWLVGQQDPRSGAEIAATIGAWSLDNGMNFWGWDLLHVSTRLGYPELVVEHLDAELNRSPTPLLQLLQRHTVAAANGDVATLETVATQFAAIEAWACCAEAFSAAAAITDDPAGSARCQVQAALAQIHCPDMRTPFLMTIESPLSDHETSVAQSAAIGKTSKEIAAERFVSARTVDNQLRSVYKKLNLQGRSELSLVFGEPTRPSRH